jgi:hypothetical protein
MTDTTIEIKKSAHSDASLLSGLRFVVYLFLPLLGALVLLAILNVIVFRHYNYYYWVKPDSTMGTAEQGVDLVSHQIVPGAKNVIVIGDSRVSEGFSAVMANAASGRHDINFIQAGMPGTEPRVWYYFLRKVDPHQDKFAAVVLMAPQYDDEHAGEDAAARTDDLTYLQPLTNYRDSFAIAASYPGFEGKIHALAAMLLPIAPARMDMFDFAQDREARKEKAKLWHDHFYEWSLGYPGAAGQMPVVSRSELKSFDFAAAGMPAVKLDAIRAYVQHVLGEGQKIPVARTAAYRERWYGSIADEYRRAGVPVMVFQVPRGPYESFLANSDSGGGSLRDLAATGKLTLLDPKPFEALEQPQYFFDSLHVNTQGRALLTPALARLVAQQIPSNR